MQLCIYFCRSLWGKESELSGEIDRLKTEVVKAEKNLDHATPGVSICFLFNYQSSNCFLFSFEYPRPHLQSLRETIVIY